MADLTTVVPVASGGQASSPIVLGERPSDTERFAAQELQSYVERLAGARVDIVDSTQALAEDDGALLLIGQPDNNPLVERVLDGKYDLGALKDEGFVIHTGHADGRPAVESAGCHQAALSRSLRDAGPRGCCEAAGMDRAVARSGGTAHSDVP